MLPKQCNMTRLLVVVAYIEASEEVLNVVQKQIRVCFNIAREI